MSVLGDLISELERACEEVGRDPLTLRRSLDVFSVAVPGVPDLIDDSTELQISGSEEAVADALLAYGGLGFAEVRVNLRTGDMPRPEAIGWMGEVVRRVHAG